MNRGLTVRLLSPVLLCSWLRSGRNLVGLRRTTPLGESWTRKLVALVAFCPLPSPAFPHPSARAELAVVVLVSSGNVSAWGPLRPAPPFIQVHKERVTSPESHSKVRSPRLAPW